MSTLETAPAEPASIALRSILSAFRDAVAQHAQAINRLNVYPVPDGDTGTNMARTLDAAVVEMDKAPPGLSAVCEAIGRGALMGARGNSGVILSQILRAISSTISAAGEISPVTVASALAAASEGADRAVLKPVEGTILTVARDTARAAVAAADAGGDMAEVLSAARAAGADALARTPELLPVLREAGVVDAGGAGYLLLLDAALHVVAGTPLPEPPEPGPGSVAPADAPAGAHGDAAAAEGTVDVSELRYEVMYLLELADPGIDAFRSALGATGDSIVVVGGDGLWNCHVHTNDIGAAVEAALDTGGRPRAIRVTDLFEEVAEEHAAREAALGTTGPGAGAAGAGAPAMVPAGPAAAGLLPVHCAVVAVCSGDGLAELFGQLGVQAVVMGGQTMNPSTAELLDAVERVNAEHVVVLPNNGNIIAVAEQVDALSGRTVVVVPTRSMPEGLAALVVYDPELDAADNAAEMRSAVEAVATGEVTQAVRDVGCDAGQVRAGDWIGLVRGDGIASIGASPVDAATALLERLLTPEREIVTIIEGSEAAAADTQRVREWVGEHRPGVQVELHRGGQPLYPYLFGVE